MTIKISKAEKDLILFILRSQIRYGWDSCLGGHEETDTKAQQHFTKDMKMVEEIISKIS